MKTMAAAAAIAALWLVFSIATEPSFEPNDVLAITAVKNELQRHWPELSNHPVDFNLADVVENAPEAVVVGSGVLTVETSGGDAVGEEKTDFRYGGSVRVRCRSWDISCYSVSDLWFLADRSVAPKL